MGSYVVLNESEDALPPSFATLQRPRFPAKTVQQGVNSAVDIPCTFCVGNVQQLEHAQRQLLISRGLPALQSVLVSDQIAGLTPLPKV